MKLSKNWSLPLYLVFHELFSVHVLCVFEVCRTSGHCCITLLCTCLLGYVRIVSRERESWEGSQKVIGSILDLVWYHDYACTCQHCGTFLSIVPICWHHAWYCMHGVHPPTWYCTGKQEARLGMPDTTCMYVWLCLGVPGFRFREVSIGSILVVAASVESQRPPWHYWHCPTVSVTHCCLHHILT